MTESSDLTPKQLAVRFQVTERMITSLARKGILPAFRVGKLWRFVPAAIEEWEKRGQMVSDQEVEEILK